ncbi:MAG: hypothetical protein NT014_07345, partial [Candidatus Omnitrophica bacterium]|nr:hypothetical protein [Candidatus Omnitrophota bacterium]
MRICRFCGKAIGDQDEICKNCGYNPQTDTMTASFVKKEKKTDSLRQQKMVSPAVMTFMLWGIAIIVFSLGIKYQGKIGDIFWNAKNIASGNKVNKSAQ